MNKGIPGLVSMIDMFTTGDRFACFSLHPLPDLDGCVFVRVEVLMGRLGDLPINLASCRIGGERSVTDEDGHPSLSRHASQDKRLPIHSNIKMDSVTISTELFDKAIGKVRILEVVACSSAIKCYCFTHLQKFSRRCSGRRIRIFRSVTTTKHPFQLSTSSV